MLNAPENFKNKSYKKPTNYNKQKTVKNETLARVYESTPVILTSCPSRASRRSESGKELRKKAKAALLWCLQLTAFQAKKEATKAERKNEREKKSSVLDHNKNENGDRETNEEKKYENVKS